MRRMSTCVGVDIREHILYLGVVCRVTKSCQPIIRLFFACLLFRLISCSYSFLPDLSSFLSSSPPPLFCSLPQFTAYSRIYPPSSSTKFSLVCFPLVYSHEDAINISTISTVEYRSLQVKLKTQIILTIEYPPRRAATMSCIRRVAKGRL